MDILKSKAQLQKEESERAYTEFINRGGVVQVIESGRRSDPQEVKSAWGRRPKKAKVIEQK